MVNAWIPKLHFIKTAQAPKEIYRGRIVRVVLQNDKKATKATPIDEDEENWLLATLSNTDSLASEFVKNYPLDSIAKLSMLGLITVKDRWVTKTEAGRAVLRWNLFLAGKL